MLTAMTTTEPGRARMSDPRVWGTIIGAVGGSVFVLANLGDLDAPWPLVARVAWLVALLLWVWTVFLRPRVFHAAQPPAPRAGLVYLGAVVGMVVLIQVGRLALGEAHQGVLPAVVVLAVGLHFLPFAGAFHAPVFLRLGGVLAVLGAVGVGLGLVWREGAADVVAVLAGLAMLVLMSLGALRPV